MQSPSIEKQVVIHIAFRPHRQLLLLTPARNGVVEGDDARSFLQLAGQARAKIAVDLGEEVKRNDCCIAKVGLEAASPTKQTPIRQPISPDLVFTILANL